MSCPSWPGRGGSGTLVHGRTQLAKRCVRSVHAPRPFLTSPQTYSCNQIRVQSCCCSGSVACCCGRSQITPGMSPAYRTCTHSDLCTSSPHAPVHLGALNALLSDNPARADISRYLVSHGFYPILRRAVMQLVSLALWYSKIFAEASLSSACPSPEAVSRPLSSRYTAHCATVYPRTPPPLPARAADIHPDYPVATQPATSCSRTVLCAITSCIVGRCTPRHRQ